MTASDRSPAAPGRFMRVRFRADEDDPRPVKWPPPGPYWVTGYGDDFAWLVAYVETLQQLIEYWPDAWEMDVSAERCEPEFTSRFPQPQWWPTPAPTPEN